MQALRLRFLTAGTAAADQNKMYYNKPAQTDDSLPPQKEKVNKTSNLRQKANVNKQRRQPK